MVRCPSCGHVFTPATEHEHEQQSLFPLAEPKLLPLGGEHAGAFGRNSPATSVEAAESIVSFSGSHEVRIRDFIGSRGDYGATCQEVEATLRLEHQTASARINALKATEVAKWLVRRGVRLGDPLLPWIVVAGRRKTRSGRDENVYVLSREARTWLA